MKVYIKDTRWPATIELGYTLDLINRNQHGYSQYKLLEAMVDTQPVIELPPLGDIDVNTFS